MTFGTEKLGIEQLEFDNQKQLFDFLWANRPQVSVISGKRLYGKEHPNWHWQFSHTLNKGLYPRYKLNPENIDFLLPNEHLFYEHFTDCDRQKPLYKLYQAKWDALFAKRERLKEQYHSEKLI